MLLLHLLDDLLQLSVLSLQLPGLLFIIVVGGGAGLQRVLLLRLPLATGDEAPHLARRQKENIKGQNKSTPKNCDTVVFTRKTSGNQILTKWFNVWSIFYCLS